MKEADSKLNSFDHLARINWATNQMFVLSGFSHAVVNPINSIMLGSELLTGFVEDITGRSDLLTAETDLAFNRFHEADQHLFSSIPQIIQNISTATFKLNQYVSHLLEFAGKGSIAASSYVDINYLAPLCISMIRHKISEHTSGFNLDMEDGLPALPGNAQHVVQMITNLLMNALLSLPDRTCGVSFSISSDNAGHIRLSVKDQGVGISQENLTRAAEPFFTTWQQHGCLGLGLTVAEHIAKSHGGELFIDSEQGKGTTALVVLPFPTTANSD